MKKLLLFLWQLPQNIIGLILVAITGAEKITVSYSFGLSFSGYVARRFNKAWSAVSLGYFKIYKTKSHLEWAQCRMHEEGHGRQSIMLGWLYLLAIGLPSLFGNIYDRTAHRKWEAAERKKWYYAQPWEAWADRLGGVTR